MSVLPFLFMAACLGFLAGFVLAAAFTAQNSYEIWEVTNLDGEKYMFFSASDVAEYSRTVGLVAVRRLRVLT